MLLLPSNRPGPPHALARVRLRPKLRDLAYAYRLISIVHAGPHFSFHRRETYPIFIHLSGQQYRNEHARMLRKRLTKTSKSQRDRHDLTT